MKTVKNIFTKRGFTLIELLVVIAIVAVLSTLSFIGFNNVRKMGRDTKRLNDIDLIQKALVFYELDHGYYPFAQENRSGTYAGSLSVSGYANSKYVLWEDFAKILKPYVSYLPVDPINNLPKQGESWNSSTTHNYEYMIFLDGQGNSAVQWLDKTKCRIVSEESADSIPVRAIVQIEFLETDKGNTQSVCTGFDVSGYEYNRSYLILLP